MAIPIVRFWRVAQVAREPRHTDPVLRRARQEQAGRPPPACRGSTVPAVPGGHHRVLRPRTPRHSARRMEASAEQVQRRIPLLRPTAPRSSAPLSDQSRPSVHQGAHRVPVHTMAPRRRAERHHLRRQRRPDATNARSERPRRPDVPPRTGWRSCCTPSCAGQRCTATPKRPPMHSSATAGA